MCRSNIVPTTTQRRTNSSRLLATCSMDACECRNDTDVLTQLLGAGGDVNARDSSQRTALHYAAAWGSEVAIKKLLECGADVSVEDRS